MLKTILLISCPIPLLLCSVPFPTSSSQTSSFTTSGSSSTLRFLPGDLVLAAGVAARPSALPVPVTNSFSYFSLMRSYILRIALYDFSPPIVSLGRRSFLTLRVLFQELPAAFHNFLWSQSWITTPTATLWTPIATFGKSKFLGGYQKQPLESARRLFTRHPSHLQHISSHSFRLKFKMQSTNCSASWAHSTLAVTQYRNQFCMPNKFLPSKT